MECMHCGAQWILKDEQIELAKCPFCGKELKLERTDKRYTDFQEALKAIARMKGIDFLIDEPSKVQALFLDITQNLQIEHKLLKIFYSNDTQKIFKSISMSDDGKYNRAVRSLQEDVFMEAESAKYIVNVFTDILGLKKEDEILSTDTYGTVEKNEADKEKKDSLISNGDIFCFNLFDKLLESDPECIGFYVTFFSAEIGKHYLIFTISAGSEYATVTGATVIKLFGSRGTKVTFALYEAKESIISSNYWMIYVRID